MTVKEYLVSTYDKNNPHLVRSPVLCADGFHISIQGGTALHYCYPRTHCNTYKFVECADSSIEEPCLQDFFDGSVYAFVPIHIVEELVERHGGIIGTYHTKIFGKFC